MYTAEKLWRPTGPIRPIRAIIPTIINICVFLVLTFGVWYVIIPLVAPQATYLTFRNSLGQEAAKIEAQIIYKGRKIFLDVGVHEGQTLEEVATVENRYGFNEVHAFDPSLKNLDLIKQRFEEVQYLFYHNFGLANFTSDNISLFSAGTLGGTLIADDQMEFPDAGVESVRLVRASQWFLQHLRPADEIFLKINCEGCEVWIIPDLVTSGAMKMVTWAR